MVTLFLTCRTTKSIAIWLIKHVVRMDVKTITNIFNDLYLCGEMLNGTRDATRALAKNNIFSVPDYAREGEDHEKFFDSTYKYWPYGPFGKTLPSLLRRIEKNAISIDTHSNKNAILIMDTFSMALSKI
ncbi:hypothetical protein [Serratia plymuthica]|uniref:hypothetical protein n=1 Tax=Serratia plymuthica TaxID=82996 RepID=UPI0018D94835|nr:hypothetical protein [Serratia plymuthica]QPS57338.1 hypothetical protein I6G53_07405 [Serratia plymuthica]